MSLNKPILRRWSHGPVVRWIRQVAELCFQQSSATWARRGSGNRDEGQGLAHGSEASYLRVVDKWLGLELVLGS